MNRVVSGLAAHVDVTRFIHADAEGPRQVIVVGAGFLECPRCVVNVKTVDAAAGDVIVTGQVLCHGIGADDGSHRHAGRPVAIGARLRQ